MICGRQVVRKKCNCGALSITFTCAELKSLPPDQLALRLTCPSPCDISLACGHKCSKACHAGPHSNVAECSKKVALKCACGSRRMELPCRQTSPLSAGPSDLDRSVFAAAGILVCSVLCAEKKAAQQAAAEAAAVAASAFSTASLPSPAASILECVGVTAPGNAA
jgi:NF-X1-type zinc finger protein NFXL1